MEETKPKLWKLKQFENVPAKLNTMENVKHIPGGGNVRVPEPKRIDVSVVKAKVSTKNELLAGQRGSKAYAFGEGEQGAHGGRNASQNSTGSNEGSDTGAVQRMPRARPVVKSPSAPTAGSNQRRYTVAVGGSTPTTTRKQSAAAPPIPPKSAQRGRVAKEPSSTSTPKTTVQRTSTATSRASNASSDTSRHRIATTTTNERNATSMIIENEEETRIRLAIEAAQERARYEAELEEDLEEFGTNLAIEPDSPVLSANGSNGHVFT